MQSPDADLGQSSLVTTAQDPSTCLPPRTEPLAEKEVSKQPYLAMGSLQWSQRVTSFSFCPEKVVSWSQASPKPAAWKESAGFQASLQQRPQDQTSRRRPRRPPPPRAPIPGTSARVLGPSGPYPGSLGVGRSRGPAMSSRNRRSPGGGVGVPASLPVPLGLAALQRLHSRDQRPAGSFRASPLGPGRMPTVPCPAGRRPAPAAAPRPQGNRREPMTDRGPAERDPPSTQPEPPANQLRGPHVRPSE